MLVRLHDVGVHTPRLGQEFVVLVFHLLLGVELVHDSRRQDLGLNIGHVAHCDQRYIFASGT
eukprot:3510367-Heterocapsa_arctica.AAC.1